MTLLGSIFFLQKLTEHAWRKSAIAAKISFWTRGLAFWLLYMQMKPIRFVFKKSHGDFTYRFLISGQPSDFFFGKQDIGSPAWLYLFYIPNWCTASFLCFFRCWQFGDRNCCGLVLKFQLFQPIYLESRVHHHHLLHRRSLHHMLERWASQTKLNVGTKLANLVTRNNIVIFI